MIDRDVLVAKTNSIQNCLKRIHLTIKGNPHRLTDFDVQDIVVLNLQRTIQLAIDMAGYIISVRRLGIPQSIKETFQILERNQIIPADLSLKMQKMVGFRNIAVHEYQTLDINILQSIVTSHLKDFEEFYSSVLRLT